MVDLESYKRNAVLQPAPMRIMRPGAWLRDEMHGLLNFANIKGRLL